MPVVDVSQVPVRSGSSYPELHARPCATRRWRALGAAAGLKSFGVNLVELPPGAWSSQRHWHTRQDELIYILEGEPTLVTDAGPRVLQPGTVVGFPAGRADGHHFINNTDRRVIFLAVGDRPLNDETHYSDIDMAGRIINDKYRYVHRDGTPY